jgi:hypothetical protein
VAIARGDPKLGLFAAGEGNAENYSSSGRGPGEPGPYKGAEKRPLARRADPAEASGTQKARLRDQRYIGEGGERRPHQNAASTKT